MQRKQILLDLQQHRCWYCGFNVTDEREWEVEHKTPRSQGGDDSDENTVLACRNCNRRKRTCTVNEYRVALLYLLDTHLYNASMLLLSFAEDGDPIAKSIQNLIESTRELVLTSFVPRFPGETAQRRAANPDSELVATESEQAS